MPLTSFADAAKTHEVLFRRRPIGRNRETDKVVNMPLKTAIAIGAHPDDIEFYMAGHSPPVSKRPGLKRTT